MVDYDENAYAVELKKKPICRFCLSQEDALTNIYSTSNTNSQVALSMQIMACVSIEVFADDEMPVTICDVCHSLMEFCYRFKQMCKKADTLLKQYPLTGLWPEKLQQPKFPLKLLQAGKYGGNKLEPNSEQQQQQQQILNQTLKRKLPQTITISKAPKRVAVAAAASTPLSQSIENNISIEDMVVEFADETIIDGKIEHFISPTASPHKRRSIRSTLGSPTSLSSSPPSTQPIKILNKQASSKPIEPILRPPVLTTNDDGKVEVLSEIVDTDESMDPIKNAAPVETNVFPCHYCERSFPLRQLLDIHMANHVRDRKFQCKVCNKGFFSKYDLGKHELIHTGEKPFACVVCGKAFSRSTLLRRHEKVHSDQPKFLCAYCERPFLSKEEWEKHTQNHQKKRPYACNYCGKSFAFKQGLERHEVIHLSDQPYKCDHCDQGFSTQGKLARHLTAHAGSRPYPCRICDKSYLLSHHLTRHMRSHKENNQIAHKCTECDLSFSKRDELILHSTLHATETMVCPLCKMHFDTIDEVNEHIRQHTDGEQYACEFCDLIFIDDGQLHEHSEMEHKDEIEFYEMSNLNDDDSMDASDNNGCGVKMETAHDDEMIEYSEQIELITADEEIVDLPPPSSKPKANSFGRTDAAKQNQTSPVKSQKTPATAKVVQKSSSSPVKAETRSGQVTTENSTKPSSFGKVTTVNVRLPNTRAAAASAAADKKSPPPKVASSLDKSAVSTRSNKTSPNAKATAGSALEKTSPAPLPTTAASPSTAAAKTTTTVANVTPTTTTTKKLTLQTSLTNFVTIKSKSNSNDAKTTTPPSTAVKKLIPLSTTKVTSPPPPSSSSLPAIGIEELPEATAKVGNKLVKVRQIRMTKAQMEALTKQGKFEMRGGQIIYKEKQSPKKK